MLRVLRSITLVAVGAAVVLVAQAAVSVTPATLSGKSVTGIKIVRRSTPVSFTDDGGATAWTDIPGAHTSIAIPAATQGILLVRFSGSSNCNGGITDGQDQCFVRILVNGVEAAPVTDTGVASFDSNDANTRSASAYYALSMDRSAGPLGPNKYVVKAQAMVYDSPCCLVTFALANYTMVVERIKA